MRRATQWATRSLILNRVQVLLFAFAVGIAIAGVVWVGIDAASKERGARQRAAHNAAAERAKLHARDRQLAAAIRRIQRLERPTKDDLRKLLASLLRAVGPTEARHLAETLRANGVALPPSPGAGTAGPPTPTHPEQPNRHREPPAGRPPPPGRPPTPVPPGPGPPTPRPPPRPTLPLVPQLPSVPPVCVPFVGCPL